MKVLINNEKCQLNNEDIKWYLKDWTLWITAYNEYEDVEKSIGYTVGSFNWLYDTNDTVLFQRESGGFETMIIHLPDIFNSEGLESHSFFEQEVRNGNLYLQEMKNQGFKFPEPAFYKGDDDLLYALPYDLKEENVFVLYLVDDFGLVIEEDELKGWILKNASRHVHIDGVEKKLCSDGCSLLSKYFNELNLWEESEDTACLKKILDMIKGRSDTVSVSIKECIESILSWEH